MPAIALDDIVKAPKALLHDHLDGGLRLATLVDLAAAIGHPLPTTNPQELGRWFVAAANSRAPRRHLAFALTVAVMQTAQSLYRVAAECAVDLAADGVVYAEVRFAPEQHLQGGLSLEEVVEAVQAGFADGAAQAAAVGRPIRIGSLLTAIRPAGQSQQIAELSVRFRDAGVVGFDIAGAEEGCPPTRHLDAFEYLGRERFHSTIHAGEAFGLTSIGQAIQWCGAERLGHAVRLVDDITPGARPMLGRLAAYVRDKRIPLELCPSSDVQTGAAESIAAHPIGLLCDLRFRVTVNTDNRLMNGTSMSREMALLVKEFGYGWAELQWLMINAMKSAFIPFDERRAIINEVIKPAYAKHLVPEEAESGSPMAAFGPARTVRRRRAGMLSRSAS